MGVPVRVTPPAAQPVTLDEARQHLRVDHADDDTLITAYIEAATAHLDGWSGVLGRALVRQSWKQSFDRFDRCMRLAMPALDVVSVRYRQADGTLGTVAADDYGLYADALGPFVRFRSGFSSPSSLHEFEPVEITYEAGYGAAADVPAPIRSAILLMVGDLYEYRASAREGGAPAVEVSTTVDRLLSPYRRMSI